MSTATDHCMSLLAAIIPDRRDLLDRALQHLSPTHFPDRSLANIFVMLERYAEVTGAIMTRDGMVDLLSAARADPGRIALLGETYDLLAHTSVDEPGFRWALDQIRELAAERATAAALTQGMEILTRGAPGERGVLLQGHRESRNSVLAAFADIDRDLHAQEAPEGDVRTEGSDILADYAQAVNARAQGGSIGIEFGIPTLDAAVGGLQPGELTLIAGYTGEGKAQPLSARVLTPQGWRRMGELRVGDEVVDPQRGEVSRVLGVYPQGRVPVLRVTFSDGATAEATEDHLWQVRLWTPVKIHGVAHQQRVERTFTTGQLAARLGTNRRMPALVDCPALAGLDFPEAPLPLEPYLLGLLLGDGCLRGATPVLSNPQPAVAEALRTLAPPGSAVHQIRTSADRCPTYSLVGQHGVNPVAQALRTLGLMGTQSFTKHVPERYKWASAKTRLAMLQGLMDTDGSSERGRGIFSSASRRLRDDVAWLARSLGLRAMCLPDKTPYYTYRGERREGRTAYRCAVWEKPALRVFRLPAKLKAIPHQDAGRRIVAVTYVRDEQCQCIKVSAASELYVTDDFVPTHNTSLAAVQLPWHTVVAQGRNVVVLTTETLRRQVRRKLIARHSCLEHFGLPGGLSSMEIKAGTLLPAMQERLRAVVADFTTNPGYGRCYVAQVPRGATVSYLEAKLVRIGRMFPIDLVVMDYLALLRADRRRQSVREELSDILKDAKQLSTTCNNGAGVPFVSPWQVSRSARREAENTGFYAPDALSETAEAGNSADTVISLLAPLDNDKRTVELKMQLMKHRDGEKAYSLSVSVDYATARFFTGGPTGRAASVDELFLGDPL